MQDFKPYVVNPKTTSYLKSIVCDEIKFANLSKIILEWPAIDKLPLNLLLN